MNGGETKICGSCSLILKKEQLRRGAASHRGVKCVNCSEVYPVRDSEYEYLRTVENGVDNTLCPMCLAETKAMELDVEYASGNEEFERFVQKKCAYCDMYFEIDRRFSSAFISMYHRTDSGLVCNPCIRIIDEKPHSIFNAPDKKFYIYIPRTYDGDRLDYENRLLIEVYRYQVVSRRVIETKDIFNELMKLCL
ncbi:MAG: hypothetical protein ACRDBG_27750 [Waterburya sp.]